MFFKNLFSLLIFFFAVQAIWAVKIISKAEWGAKPATRNTTLPNGLYYAVIHHTAGDNCFTKATCILEIQGIQNYHQNILGWDDIGYNFLIGGDGNIYEGRGWNVLGAHALNWNSKSIGICLMGNYNNDQPTEDQIKAAKEILAEAVSRGQITSNYILKGHRQVGATECPGNNLFNEIKTWSHWQA